MTNHEMQAYLNIKKKGHRAGTSSKGFGRQGDPKGKDGKVMTCHGCGSDQHLNAMCPNKKGGGKAGGGDMPAPTFTTHTDQNPYYRSTYHHNHGDTHLHGSNSSSSTSDMPPLIDRGYASDVQFDHYGSSAYPVLRGQPHGGMTMASDLLRAPLEVSSVERELLNDEDTRNETAHANLIRETTDAYTSRHSVS